MDIKTDAIYHYHTGKIPKPIPQHYRTGKIPKTAATETTGEIAMTGTGYMPDTTDKVRIWDAARTEDEISAQIYTESIGNELPLVTHWDFTDSLQIRSISRLSGPLEN